jgi:hypothetical protein
LHVKPKFLNDELSDVKGLINLSMERGAKVSPALCPAPNQTLDRLRSHTNRQGALKSN